MSKLYFLLIVTLLTCTLVFAQDTQRPNWFDNVTVNGFISTAFSYNTNKPANLQNQYHVFDFDDQTFKIDVAELSFKKDAPSAGDVGFRLDLTAGSAIPRIAHSSGMDIGNLDFHQMSITYVAPLGKGLRFDLGKFITPFGYEVIEGYDGYNDNYTRSLMFGYAIPFTHTGLKASYQFSDEISALLMVANGWDNSVDSNTSKSIGAQFTVIPTAGCNVIAGMMYGPEKPGNTIDNRMVLDLVATYAISEQFTLGCNVDYGTEEHSNLMNETAEWFGIAGYVKYKAFEDFSFALRVEQFKDTDGFRTSVQQTLNELTLTGEYRVKSNFILRTDLRFDNSDKDVFLNETTLKNNQSTIGLNAIFLF